MSAARPQPGAILRCDQSFRMFEAGRRYELQRRDSAVVAYLRDVAKPITNDDRHTIYMATWHLAEAIDSAALVVESNPARALCPGGMAQLRLDRPEAPPPPSITDRQRQRIARQLASPKRAGAGRIVQDQADAGHLPLFIAANEPVLL